MFIDIGINIIHIMYITEVFTMKNFLERSLSIFDSDWALVTAGNKQSYNTMTIAWGGIGTLWTRPICTVYIKPCRYTHSFMEKNDYFTVSFYDEKYKNELGFLGRHSGRDCDKVSEVGFSAIECGESITFNQAKITLLCKKIYQQQLNLDNMPKEVIEKYYTEESPHTMFVGQVIDIIEN